MIRVLVADDQSIIRRGLRVILEGCADIEIIGEASSGPEAVDSARRLGADVVLMDVRMPEGDGIAATRELACGGTGEDSAASGPAESGRGGQDGPEPIPVILLTTFDLDEYVFGALEAGAAGFLLKSAEPEEIVAAIRAVAAGEGMVSPAVTRRVIAEFARRREGWGSPKDGGASDEEIARNARALLTKRELDIVRTLCEGASTDGIAEALSMEHGTVKTHMSRIMGKIGASSRVQIVIWAFRNRIVS